MSQEIAVKSEHLKNLRAQIDQLESEKSGIEEWRKKKEKEVDALSEKAREIQEQIVKDKRAFEVEKKTLELERQNINARLDGVANGERDLANRKLAIEEREKTLTLAEKDIQDRLSLVLEREFNATKRENFIKAIFEGIESLNGK